MIFLLFYLRVSTFMNEEDKSKLNEVEPNKEIPPTNDNSSLFGVTIRGWIAMGVVATICLMSGLKIDIKEPLYTLAGLIVGFYFGQNPKKS
jgi:hypothetical protein